MAPTAELTLHVGRPFTGVRVLPGYWSAAECGDYIDTVRREAGWEAAAMGRYQDNEVVSQFIDKELRDVDVLNLEATALGNPFLRKPGLLDLVNEELDCDGARISRAMVSRYTFGSHIKPHKDTGFFDTSRLATVVLYLNDGFEGGEIYFPDISLEMKPSVGDLLVFYSEYRHGVRPVTSGTRLGLVAFCENDLAYRKAAVH